MIKLKDGRYYKDRTGRVFLVHLNDTRNPRHSLYPFTGKLVGSGLRISFTEDGKYLSYATNPNKKDLIEEVRPASKLKVGQRWRRQDGVIAKIIGEDKSLNAFHVEDPTQENGTWFYYNTDGKFCRDDYGLIHFRDLISLVVEGEEEDEVSPHDGKADQGKVDVDRLDRYFPDALLEVAKVLEFGAKKYTEGGWSSVPNGINRYQAAARRHKLARNRGEVLDPESNLEHWAHQICSELMAFSLYLKDK